MSTVEIKSQLWKYLPKKQPLTGTQFTG